jgi:hypothetical protein
MHSSLPWSMHRLRGGAGHGHPNGPARYRTVWDTDLQFRNGLGCCASAGFEGASV